jgi:hypothetical protein
MNGSRTLFRVVMAIAGALLFSAVMFLISVVLDLSTTVAAVLEGVAAVVGAWYGWRLARGIRLGRRG